MRSAYLVMVEPDENHNKYYQMTQKTTDTFEVRYGRVGAKGITRKYPISRWASIYESKLQKGYIDNSHLYSPTINTRYKEIPDKAVRSFWQDIENYSKKMLESNYSVSYDKVTQEMIKEATDILKNMRNQSNVFCINGELLTLFQVIPRKMKKVEDYLLKDISELPTVLEREWDLLDVMKGRMLAKQDKQNQKEKAETAGVEAGTVRYLRIGERASAVKTFYKEDADKFALLTGDNNRLHTDREFSERQWFGRPVVHGVLTASLLSTVMGTKMPGNGTILMSENLEFVNPVYFGDTVEAVVTFVSCRETKLFYVGEFYGECRNQRGETVVTGTVRQMMMKSLFCLTGGIKQEE